MFIEGSLDTKFLELWLCPLNCCMLGIVVLCRFNLCSLSFWVLGLGVGLGGARWVVVV